VDAEHFDFRLESDSPAPGVGFKPFDFAKAGIQGDPGLAKEAAASLPPTRFAPPPPPPIVHEDFESAETGDYAPEGAALAHGDRPDLVSITDQGPFRGRRSLKVADASGLKNGFDPHFYYQPHYDRGVATCSFAAKFEPGASFYHEWRDDASPYRAGPSFRVDGGKLLVAGRNPIEIPAGSWIRFEIRVDLGDKKEKEGSRPRTWSLTVEKPGERPATFDGLPCSEGWKTVDWVGFVSDARGPTAFYLDDLDLNVRPAGAGPG
jgi:hypothetical protein